MKRPLFVQSILDEGTTGDYQVGAWRITKRFAKECLQDYQSDQDYCQAERVVLDILRAQKVGGPMFGVITTPVIGDEYIHAIFSTKRGAIAAAKKEVRAAVAYEKKAKCPYIVAEALTV